MSRDRRPGDVAPPPARRPGRGAAGLSFGSIYARHFFGMFLLRFAAVFLFLQLFLGLCAVLIYLWMHPYLPPVRMVLAFPDHVLLLLPLSLAFSSLIAGLLFLSEVRRRQGFLAIRLAGRDPRLFQLPILAFAAAQSLALLWLTSSVLPVIQYQRRYPELRTDTARLAVPLLVLREEGVFLGARVRFERMEDGEMAHLSICRRGPDSWTAVTARRAGFSLAGDPPRLTVNLRGGRLLEVKPPGRVVENLRFDTFEVTLDASGLFRESKTEMLSLRYYTNAELERLPEEGRFRLAHGVRLSPAQRRKLAAVPFVEAARVELALSPLLFLLLLVAFLGGHVEGRLWLRSSLVAALGLCVYLPQVFVFTQTPVKRGVFSKPWAAWLPLLEVGAVFVIGVAVDRRSWWFRRRRN